jgi:hypothetical protein
MFSFAFLFVVLFFSMLVNYMTSGLPELRVFVIVIKSVLAALVAGIVVFYQWARMSSYIHDKSFIVLLDMFAAVDLMLIFYNNNVDVFNIIITLYLVVGLSAIIWIIFGLLKKKKEKYNLYSYMSEFYSFMNEIKVTLVIMAAVILTQSIIAAFSRFENSSLVPAYMFFATATLVLQLTQIMIVEKNLFFKIAAVVMFLSGLVYGFSLVPFFGITFSSTAFVVTAIVFGLSVIILGGGNLYKSGKANKDPKAKIFIKDTVLALAGFVMAILFINGITEIPQNVINILYAVSLVLALALLVYMLLTYKYEKIITDPSYVESLKQKKAKKSKKSEAVTAAQPADVSPADDKQSIAIQGAEKVGNEAETEESAAATEAVDELTANDALTADADGENAVTDAETEIATEE